MILRSVVIGSIAAGLLTTGVLVYNLPFVPELFRRVRVLLPFAPTLINRATSAGGALSSSSWAFVEPALRSLVSVGLLDPICSLRVSANPSPASTPKHQRTVLGAQRVRT